MDAPAPLVERARTDPDVLAILHFGSSARGEEHRDIDATIVLTDQAQVDRWDKVLEYGRLVSERVDLSVFQELPVVVRSRILAEARVLWCRDPEALHDIAWRTAREFEDFYPRYKAYLEEAGRA